jgi:hypothetical protein
MHAYSFGRFEKTATRVICLFQICLKHVHVFETLFETLPYLPDVAQLPTPTPTTWGGSDVVCQTVFEDNMSESSKHHVAPTSLESR